MPRVLNSNEILHSSMGLLDNVWQHSIELYYFSTAMQVYNASLARSTNPRAQKHALGANMARVEGRLAKLQDRLSPHVDHISLYQRHLAQQLKHGRGIQVLEAAAANSRVMLMIMKSVKSIHTPSIETAVQQAWMGRCAVFVETQKRVNFTMASILAGQHPDGQILEPLEMLDAQRTFEDAMRQRPSFQKMGPGSSLAPAIWRLRALCGDALVCRFGSKESRKEVDLLCKFLNREISNFRGPNKRFLASVSIMFAASEVKKIIQRVFGATLTIK